MRKFSTIALAMLLMVSCSDHFISSEEYRTVVAEDLSEKVSFLDGRLDMASVLDQCSSEREREAMEFLYAYMPLGDIADYPSDLYLNAVRYSFRAQEELPWGDVVPEDLFRHFVLPVRVNNENLDRFREVVYDELSERVKGLSMYDAILEVNHWCHEKVIYTPSDARTSAPLASMKTAYGRCGEESVFAVAALRAVGIPARQVYTPRWAHTDDNHAWVEAWADGKWYYLGACEPEAKLNVAWFSSTALRALLMHSKVFGRYQGEEDVIDINDCFTEINVTSNYAPTERVRVKVTDDSGRPVEGAVVEYKIYNYSEFYSAITDHTDGDGVSTATFGLGDILVWCSKGEKYGFKKCSVKKGEASLTVVLDRESGEKFYEELDIVPPAAGKAELFITAEEMESNALRLDREDSIRALYTATFPGRESAADGDFEYLEAARGNWKEIEKVLNRKDVDPKMVRMLFNMVSLKDLRDTPSEVFLDFLTNCKYKGLFPEYVLNPRVANEILTPYRSFFMRERAGNAFGEEVTPSVIVEFVKRVKLADNYNMQRVPISPAGVYKMMAADRGSRDIFFVALCRSFDIPARKEEVSGKLQYHDGTHWIDVDLDGESDEGSVAQTGRVRLVYEGQKFIDDPKYDTHFTLSKIENGTPRLLHFNDKEGLEGTRSWKGLFNAPVSLDEGEYMLVTGTRMASGKVLATMTAFEVEDGETTDVKLVMREDAADLQVIGAMNPEDKFILKGSSSGEGLSEETSILATTGRGYFVLLFARSNHEPSNHAIRRIIDNVPEIPVILLFGSDSEYDKYLGRFPALPEGIHVGIDKSGGIRSAICKEMKLGDAEYPLYVVADTFGRIVYVAHGYDVTTAERISRMKF